jgi:nucleoside-diphosphate-sugar epimerase
VNSAEVEKEESAFDKVASMGLAGILAITAAESIFWAAGVPLAALYYRYTTGEWIDIMSTDGQLKAAGFSFGYGGFATAILQYRVTIFAIPLVPFMQKYIVEPGKKLYGEGWGESDTSPNGANAKRRQYTIVGATSGVGQCIATKLQQEQPGTFMVKAVTRDVEAASSFSMLENCDFVQADARDTATLPAALEGTTDLIITIGTTAFPSKKWGKNKENDPKAACLDSVVNILEAVRKTKSKPQKIVLISSVGVERASKLPFSILNSFGVLDYKRRSEEVLRGFSAETGIPSVIIRPGRLVGAPFTNTDLAALFKTTQGTKKKIITDSRDVIAGDTERRDVATAVYQSLLVEMEAGTSATFSIVNAAGAAQSDESLASQLRSLLRSSRQQEARELVGN